jgi:conjugal transfer pilus assembly protein TraK
VGNDRLAMVLAIACTWCTGAVHAAQALDVRDGDTAMARISVRDQTRIRVDRGRITEVLGDIYDQATNPNGRVALMRDDGEGEVYVKPMPAPAGASAGELGQASPAANAPVKLDVKTDRGTFALLLQPSDVVGDTLVLRPVGMVRARPESEQRRAAAHERAIKALALSMANPGLEAGVKATSVAGGGQEVTLWKEAKFVLREQRQTAGLVGQTYDLTNVSGKRMVIDERELFREGVLAVSVKRLTLAPGESTPVWIVRQESQD